MVPVTAMIKLVCASLLAIIMIAASPSVLRMWFGHEHEVVQTTLPERVTGDEARISNLEHRMDILETAKIGERLSAIEARQGIVLMFLAPMALFVFTHSYEVWTRLLGKNKTRETDQVEHREKRTK